MQVSWGRQGGVLEGPWQHLGVSYGCLWAPWGLLELQGALEADMWGGLRAQGVLFFSSLGAKAGQQPYLVIRQENLGTRQEDVVIRQP